jgi:hypothetical protein
MDLINPSLFFPYKKSSVQKYPDSSLMIIVKIKTFCVETFNLSMMNLLFLYEL